MLLDGLAILLRVLDLDQEEENEIRIPRVDSNPTFSEFNVKNIVHLKADGKKRDQEPYLPSWNCPSWSTWVLHQPPSATSMQVLCSSAWCTDPISSLGKSLTQNLAIAVGIKKEREDATGTLHLHLKRSRRALDYGGGGNYRARALRALGLLLADGSLTVGWG